MALAPAQLENVWVNEVRFRADPNFERDDAPKTSYVVDAETDMGELVTEDDGEMWAFVTVDAKIEWTRTDDPEAPLPFEIEVQIQGMFSWAPEMRPDSDRIASLWLDYNALYLMWPYLRNYINTITAMSRLPPLTIYTMSVPKPPRFDEPEDAEQVEKSSDAATADPS